MATKKEKSANATKTPVKTTKAAKMNVRPILATSEPTDPSTIEIKPIIRHRHGVIKWA